MALNVQIFFKTSDPATQNLITKNFTYNYNP